MISDGINEYPQIRCNKEVIRLNMGDELQEIIESSYKLYDWCQENNVNMKIASDVSPIDERFERVTKLEDI